MLTIDTEALPKRAPENHVARLIWGRHGNGTAGIREMCAVADEVEAKLTFFVDACGAYSQLDEVAEVVRWLDGAGHDVQLHTHSEYLPERFWIEHGFTYRPRFLNQYADDKATFTIRHFGEFISGITGKPLRAFRAGSFRWNASTVRALAEVGIPLSFNASMNAFLAEQCTYSEPTNQPYVWSNGVIEVPITERKFFPLFGKEWWGRLQFPVSNHFRNPPWRVLRPYARQENSSLLVLLLHSWSLLYWDKNGYGVYRDDKRIEDFRKLVRQLAKDYDIITTEDFLDLHARGKITTSHTVDLAAAELKR
ncbi:MAG: polysaccharide deacetylase [Betaproteobacteria bacterium HGW-Betaproteobacteria-12]|nr:MAG: polysaccharide deacetylase [Betaproteobacteria bacterium HGW-Betaproteobacteria-12]